MGRQLDATAGSILEEISRKNGIAIHTGVSISSIDGDESGAVSGVSLSSGETFPADLSSYLPVSAPTQAWLRKWALKQRRQ